MNKRINATNVFRTYGTIIAGVIIIIMFSILRPQSFATISNAINITRQISLLVVISIGATLIMAVEEFDLSIGAMASLGGVLAAKLSVNGIPVIFALLIALAICFIIGYVNGYIVTKFKVLSFITTLAMGTIIGGFTFWFTGGSTVFENIPKGFTFLGTKTVLSLPLLSIIMLLLTILFWFIMRHTVFGRKLYAIGGNEVAAQVSGLNVKMNKNLAFALCGSMAALTGMLTASRLGSAHPTGGDGFFLSAYAAVFLGRTVFKEGVPTIWGTFIGAAILGILANGLTILQIPTFMQDILTGMIIITAVVVQKMGANKHE
ncbi:MAG: ABC transporter permease [Firmicutes bacterium HGW-Firmicutes-7]|nr:MAG: ABC transporter permease [Firmicutes bacterium HGW-Firmicutes-7]